MSEFRSHLLLFFYGENGGLLRRDAGSRYPLLWLSWFKSFLWLEKESHTVPIESILNGQNRSELFC